MKRLFVAISPPQEVCRDIAELARTVPGGRPVVLEQLHLTLKFIGEVEGGKLLDIKEALVEISRPAFSLSLRGVGVFPPRGMPRVVWVGIEPVEEVDRLRRDIEKTLFAAGIPKEKQKFAPHLTLAKLKDANISLLQSFMAGNSLLRSPPFEVTAFTLFSSQLTAKGALHSEVVVYPLKAPPAAL
jgi:RNA 2',3'-cyclic 3'-phosphodiesterase